MPTPRRRRHGTQHFSSDRTRVRVSRKMRDQSLRLPRRPPRDRPRPPLSRGPDREGGRRCVRLCKFVSTINPIASSHDGIARCSTDRLRVPSAPISSSSSSSPRSLSSPSVSSSSSRSSSSSILSSRSTGSTRVARAGGRGRALSRRGRSASRGSVDRSSDCAPSGRRPRPRPRRRRGLPRRCSDDSSPSPAGCGRSPPSNSSPCSANSCSSAWGSAKPLPASRGSSRSSIAEESGRVSSSTIFDDCSAGEPNILCHRLTAAGFGGSSRGGAGRSTRSGRSGRCWARSGSLTGGFDSCSSAF